MGRVEVGLSGRRGKGRERSSSGSVLQLTLIGSLRTVAELFASLMPSLAGLGWQAAGSGV